MSGRYTKKELNGLTEVNSNLPIGVVGAGVHGKFIYLILDGGYSLWCTLGMSGRWSTTNDAHSRVELKLNNATSVYFVDQRNFGTLKFVAGKERLIEKLQSLGPDMFTTKMGPEKFVKLLRKKNSHNICKVLMDQSVIAGVGNYLKADSLWAAKIYPFANIQDLSDNELSVLFTKIKEIIQASYDNNGATISAYRDIFGENGDYSSRFLVYNRKCDAMGNSVVRNHTPDGRKTHWSPDVQTRGMKNEVI